MDMLDSDLGTWIRFAFVLGWGTGAKVKFRVQFCWWQPLGILGFSFCHNPGWWQRLGILGFSFCHNPGWWQRLGILGFSFCHNPGWWQRLGILGFSFCHHPGWWQRLGILGFSFWGAWVPQPGVGAPSPAWVPPARRGCPQPGVGAPSPAWAGGRLGTCGRGGAARDWGDRGRGWAGLGGVVWGKNCFFPRKKAKREATGRREIAFC